MPESVLNKAADHRPATLLKKEILTQVFSCEFCGIFKNAFFYRTLPVAASARSRNKTEQLGSCGGAKFVYNNWSDDNFKQKLST